MKEQHNLAKWLAGEMTPNELEAFEKSEDFKTYTKIKDISQQLKVNDFDSEKMYQNIISHKKKKKVIRLQDLWYMKMAAVLVLALGVTLFIKSYVQTTEHALAGERTTFLLPDNSEIVLNADSEINYKKWNWDNDRSLNLKGEAYFKVAKGQKFLINTTLGKVTVLGTQFNVKVRNNNFEVECYEGKVKVDFSTQTVYLTQGEQIVLQNGIQILSTSIINSQPNWMSDEIKFNNNTLKEVIQELERQYDVTIETNTDSVELFTGTLPLKNLEVALQIICKTHHLNYKKTTNQKIILSKK